MIRTGAIALLALALLCGAPPPLAAQDSHLAAPAQALPLLGAEMLLPHLARSGPFARPLGVALLLAAEDAEIAAELDALRPLAARGAPTLRVLAADFAAAVDQAISIEAGLERGGMLGRMIATTMRFGAGLGGAATPVLAAANEAAARLAEGDVARAEAVLSALEGPPAAALRAWRDAARDRLRLDAASARLVQIVSRRLGDAR